MFINILHNKGGSSEKYCVLDIELDHADLHVKVCVLNMINDF